MIPTDPPIEHLCDSKPRASGDDPDHKVTVLPTSHRPHERSGNVGAVDVAEFLRWVLSI